MSLKRWGKSQKKKFFHVSKPLECHQKQLVFDKFEPLSEYLRTRFKLYWEPGMHLAVGETNARFKGRASETVNTVKKLLSVEEFA